MTAVIQRYAIVQTPRPTEGGAGAGDDLFYGFPGETAGLDGAEDRGVADRN